MTSSDQRLAQEALDQLAAALHPDNLNRLIEAPMETATARLLQSHSQPTTTKEFNTILGAFYRDLVAEGSLSKQVLPFAEAFADAVNLLNCCYGNSGNGYYDALVDVVQDGTQSMELILQSVAAAMTERERASYIRWKLCVCLEPLSWSARCAMVELINQSQVSSSDQPLYPGSPGRYVDELEDVVMAHVSAMHAMQYCGSQTPFHRLR